MTVETLVEVRVEVRVIGVVKIGVGVEDDERVVRLVPLIQQCSQAGFVTH